MLFVYVDVWLITLLQTTDVDEDFDEDYEDDPGVNYILWHTEASWLSGTRVIDNLPNTGNRIVVHVVAWELTLNPSHEVQGYHHNRNFQEIKYGSK